MFPRQAVRLLRENQQRDFGIAADADLTATLGSLRIEPAIPEPTSA